MDFSELTQEEPREAPDSRSSKKHSGRNFNGHITVRHKGGGTRRQYRIIDFKRDKDAIPAKVAAIEYDPNRSARIALLHYKDGEKRYILAPVGVQVGDVIESGPAADIKTRQRAAAQEYPARYGDSQHRIATRARAASSSVRPARRRS